MPRSFSISATNPCHLYDVARSLSQRGLLDTYYSGYPTWKLRRSEGMTIRSFSARTLVVYGLLKTIPERYRLSNRTLFRWQDENFDRRVARELRNDSSLVAIPGQALESFRRARQLGMKTILSHATGPLQRWMDLVREEFNRVGVPFSEHSHVDEETLKRHVMEYELTDLHWVPSQIVKKQMIDVGIDEEKIRVIPFGADPVIFRRVSVEPKPLVVFFAGQLTWRKGLRLLDRVIPQLPPKIQIHFAGPAWEESREWVAKWSGDFRVKFWGSLSAESLAAKMREARVLILHSVEESFGLVVPQSLSSGTPCLVSDRVGSQDLIVPGIHGEVLPWDSPEAWTRAIIDWVENPRRVEGTFDWEKTTDLFLERI